MPDALLMVQDGLLAALAIALVVVVGLTLREAADHWRAWRQGR